MEYNYNYSSSDALQCLSENVICEKGILFVICLSHSSKCYNVFFEKNNGIANRFLGVL